ncbi:MAG: hypothetical protein A3D44_04310 [Candidatus Staskawiczbacteria bacterium RIFCSPHIGHO2_02_FULL_42_22]|uniref:Uncharacterized protein n=1 Tax=Candidatus Staskawiczbacteria bacterium RIFCSPHIGHO2_02_FULL_42_22 TaxID=1802207 RepID=A0A1G2I257_9BACT|nr:MAG: hypothetical protein A3D44_04310 [Candidatus Staskawiczbacteria bacterium RIFCSPHIGHO2_02_FULL_42_22]
MEMKIPDVARNPELSPWGFPDWFHHHGMKMYAGRLNREQKSLRISGSAAFLGILPAESAVFDGWLVTWRVVYSRNERTEGQVFFTTEELAAAFGLAPITGSSDDWLIERYGAHSAFQGKYISWRRDDGNVYLNIPCPGTGHDGDPNISIEVSPEMSNVVKELLQLP